MENKSVTEQMTALLKPKGIIAVFEHNPYNPLTRYIVKHCPFDTDAVLLTMNETKRRLFAENYKVCQADYTLFLTNFLRQLRGLEKYLSWLPLGGQYAVLGEKFSA